MTTVNESNSPYDITSGQSESGDVVVGGGSMFVLAGGTADATTVSAGGFLTVSSGGTVIGTTLAADDGGYATETISAGGTALGGTLSGGIQNVFGYTSGGTEYGADGQRVESGGTAIGTTLVDSGFQYLGDPNFSIGNAVGISTIISSGGEQWIGYGGAIGTAIATTIDNGGFQWLGAFGGKGTASGTIISSGGEEEVGDTTGQGGKGTAIGTTIGSGGTEVVESGGTTSATLINGGILELTSKGLASGSIAFAGAGGTLRIDATVMPTNTISGLAIGDVIDLAGVAFSAGGSVALQTGNVLKIVEGGKTYDLHLNPSQSFAADAFNASVDSATGTQIVVSPNPAPPTVVSAASPESGAYGTDRTVTFTLQMNLPVDVSGTPTLTLNDGGTATYTGGSGTNALTFSYTIGAGQDTTQLTTSLATLSGGTIEGLTGTAVNGSSTAKIAVAVNTSALVSGTVTLSANTEAALQAAIDVAASGETIKFHPGGASMTLNTGLVIPTGTDVTIDGFGDGTGTFDGFTLSAAQPIVVEQGATAVFSYVNVNFSETTKNGAEGGEGSEGEKGENGANGSSPGQSGAHGAAGDDGGSGATGATGLSVAGAVENDGTLTLDHVSITAKSEAGDGGGGGKGGAGGAGGNGGSGAPSPSGGGAGAAGGSGGEGGNGGNGGNGGSAIGAILNNAGATLTLQDALITGSAKAGDGGDGGNGANAGNGGNGGNGGSGLPNCPGGAAGAGANSGDGGNAGVSGNGGSAVGGISNDGTLKVDGAALLFDDDSDAGAAGKTAEDAGSAGTAGHAGTPGTGKPTGTTSVNGTAGNDGAAGTAGAFGGSTKDLAGANPISGTLTIDQHMYEFDPKSLNPATVMPSSGGTTFTYKVDIYGPKASGSVQWEVATSIPATDFVGDALPEGTLTFTSGGATSQSISFSLKPDASQALDESFTVELIAPINGDILGINSSIVQNVTNLNIDTWKAGAKGDWSTTSDWSTGALPTPSTQASIAAGGTASSTASDDPTVASIVTVHGATLDITGGTFTATMGTGTGVNAGAVLLGDGATFETGGTFAGNGTISLGGTASATTLEIDGTALTLSGGGKVMLSDSGNNAVVTGGGAATLTNVNDTIVGAGTIGDANLALVNQAGGVVDGDGVANALTLSAATTNAGIIEGTASQGLLVAADIANAKTIEALGTSATVEIVSTTISNTSAGLVLASGSGAVVRLDHVTISGGKLQTAGKNAAIATVSGSDNTISGGSIAAGSLVEATDGSTLTVTGTVADAGTILVQALTSATTLALDNATISGGALQTSGADALIETVSASADAIKGASIVSGSLVEVTSGNTLTLSGGSIGSGAAVVAASSGTLVVSGTLTNSGTLVASGADSTVDIVGVVNGGSAVVGDGVVDIAAGSKENISFQSAGTGGLKLDDAIAYAGKISGFGGTNHTNDHQYIDLTDVSFTNLHALGYTSANASNTSGTLTVTDGTHTAHLVFVGAYTLADFATPVNDGSGGVKITDPAPAAGGVQSANVALFGNYLAASFATAAGGHGGTVITEPAPAGSQQPLLTSPHA